MGARIPRRLKPYAIAPMVWVPSQLSARALLDASSQRGGFITCNMRRLSSAVKPSRWECEYATRNVITHVQTTAIMNLKTWRTRPYMVVLSATKVSSHLHILSNASIFLLWSRDRAELLRASLDKALSNSKVARRAMTRPLCILILLPALLVALIHLRRNGMY